MQKTFDESDRIESKRWTRDDNRKNKCVGWLIPKIPKLELWLTDWLTDRPRGKLKCLQARLDQIYSSDRSEQELIHKIAPEDLLLEEIRLIMLRLPRNLADGRLHLHSRDRRSAVLLDLAVRSSILRWILGGGGAGQGDVAERGGTSSAGAEGFGPAGAFVYISISLFLSSVLSLFF